VVQFHPPPSALPAVVTTTITAAPNADTLGVGAAKLRVRNGATLADGQTGVVVYSNLSTAVASGKRCTVAPYGSAYLLINADCP
jgi:hypothetical protein